jgi:hypothetical protein
MDVVMDVGDEMDVVLLSLLSLLGVCGGSGDRFLLSWMICSLSFFLWLEGPGVSLTVLGLC